MRSIQDDIDGTRKQLNRLLQEVNASARPGTSSGKTRKGNTRKGLTATREPAPTQLKIAILPSVLASDATVTKDERLMYEWTDCACSLFHSLAVSWSFCEHTHEQLHTLCETSASKAKLSPKETPPSEDAETGSETARLGRFLRGRAQPSPDQLQTEAETGSPGKVQIKSFARMCLLRSFESLKDGIDDMNKRLKFRAGKLKDLQAELKKKELEIEELRTENDTLKQQMLTTDTSQSLSAQTSMLQRALSKAMEDIVREREKSSKIAISSHKDTQAMQKQIAELQAQLGIKATTAATAGAAGPKVVQKVTKARVEKDDDDAVAGEGGEVEDALAMEDEAVRAFARPINGEEEEGYEVSDDFEDTR